MDFYRATESDTKYIKHEKSLIHNTALIASEDAEVIGVLEYEIKNLEEAEIINFNIFKFHDERVVFKGFIDEIKYWNSYLKRILCKDGRIIKEDILKDAGFKKESAWILHIRDYVEVFKIDINKITPEQLIADKVKINKVSSWIESSEDIVITCVKIKDKIVCIDGYSRLLVAYNKGFKYVYAYFEEENVDIKFFETCLKWCEKEKIFTIKDLTNRIVIPEEHERLWVSRCQAYFREQK